MVLLAVAAFYLIIVCCLTALRWVDPFTTAVQVERRVAALIAHQPYRKSFHFEPANQISPSLRHAVVAAEDARFYQHHGFDWTEVQNALEADLKRGKTRGASTITQQLVKNLFLSTGRSFIRKGIEFTIVPLTELLLSKDRILELYINVIEWGPGVYGAEAAAENYYRVPARRLTREQSVELASIIPAPLHRKPGRQPDYARRTAERMSQMGW